VLTTVVTSGTGKNAQTGEPTWGKTGTTDDNGDAWFCGATDEITVCVWVGHADTVEPMKTEFGGSPVDGGTFPALIFADVVNAYTSLEDARKAGQDPDVESSGTTSPSTETTPEVDSGQTAEPSTGGGGDGGGGTDGGAPPAAPAGDGSSGGSVTPSGGGISPG
jgi:penicillin-binding protein 1A